MEGQTDEHRMLQDSLNAVLSTTVDPAEIWSQLAELGILGLTLPEDAGGAGLGMTELMIFARTLGRTCISTPYLAAEILTVPLLAKLTAHPAVAPQLAGLIDGSRIATLALDDRVPVTAKKTAAGSFRLTGEKTLVPAGADADLLVLSAALNHSSALFLLDFGSQEVSRTAYLLETADGRADITLTDVVLPEDALLAQGGEAMAMIEDARARGQLATCAAMLGGMEALLELTVDYLRTRQQFGQPLAAFQALQHAAVDMYVELETARAMLNYGNRLFGAPTQERAQALNAVKLKMNSAAKCIGESAVQLHGAIGMTQENMTGRLFARLTSERLVFGDSRECLNRLLANDASIALS